MQKHNRLVYIIAQKNKKVNKEDGKNELLCRKSERRGAVGQLCNGGLYEAGARDRRCAELLHRR